MKVEQLLIAMNTDTHFRRNHSRRQSERRANPFPFNSPEWIAVMKESYELWPKYDRREMERRTADRRAAERRTQRRNSLAAKHLRRSNRFTADDILAEDEKKMIMDLFRND